MVETLGPRREKILRGLVRVVGQSMTGARIEDVKRYYRGGYLVRLRPENGEHEELVLPAEDVRVQGRVVRPPRSRA